VEPGVTRSNFESTIGESGAMGTDAAHSPYEAMRRSIAKVNSESYANQRLSASSESVAVAIVKAVEAGNPRARYLLTPAARALVATRTLGGTRMWDSVVRRQYRL
ncbi:MAG: hypothetical protein ACRCZD_08075, partial [Phycicoccus sp.]